MIEHVVLLRFKAAVSPETRRRVLAELRTLKASVPSVVELSCGDNFSERSQGYEAGLVVRFKDKQGLESYIVNAEHQRIVQDWIRPNAEQILALDYEF